VRRGLVMALGLAALGAATATGAFAAPPSIIATADPASPLFADPFSYVVVVKTPAADAARVRIRDDVGPFARVAPTHTTRSVSKGVATTTVTETLACLTAACMSSSPDGRSVSLPPARAVLDGATTTAIPVIVRVGTRVPSSEVTARQPPFRRPRALPAAGYRVSPGTLEVALVVTGVLLLGVAVLGIAVPILRRRQKGRAATEADPVTRAVRLLRESAERDAADRRRAAGLAARVVDRPDLSLDAATVAWSRPEPAPPDATSLADRVERAEAPA
jgi:hypothetical protein